MTKRPPIASSAFWAPDAQISPERRLDAAVGLSAPPDGPIGSVTTHRQPATILRMAEVASEGAACWIAGE